MAQGTEAKSGTPLEQLARLVKEHKTVEAEIQIPQKLMEQVLAGFRETTEHLQEMQKQFMKREKMAALGHLIAGIAHEISTPVASINSNVDLLARALVKIKMLASESLPDSSHSATRDRQIMQMVDVLESLNQSNQTACDVIVQIVRSLRSFIRYDVTELREVDIHEELENSLTLVHHELKRRIEVIRKYGDIPKCTCHPGRLNGVFVNMLMNAAQAIEGKGRISIETLRAGDSIKIKFTDTGEGIPPENLEKLFDRGFTTKSPEEGTGIGLAICKQIMDEHHGEIEVESQVGKGTTFTITLPVEIEP